MAFLRIAGLATTGQRKRFADEAIKSLVPQMDFVHLYNNGEEPVDLTDRGKFKALEKYECPVYYFSCDDDLIYPPDYSTKMIAAVEKYKCIVTLHGRKLLGLDRHYYRGHILYHCLREIPQHHYVDVGGTGVMCFRTDWFSPMEVLTESREKMSDLLVSLIAAKQGKKILVLKHAKAWLKYQNMPRGITIAEQVARNPIVQNKIADEIFLIKNP